MSAPLEESLRKFARDTLTKSLNDKRLRPNAVCKFAEELGLLIRVPATEDQAKKAKCEVGYPVWVMSDRLTEGRTES